MNELYDYDTSWYINRNFFTKKNLSISNYISILE